MTLQVQYLSTITRYPLIYTLLASYNTSTLYVATREYVGGSYHTNSVWVTDYSEVIQYSSILRIFYSPFGRRITVVVSPPPLVVLPPLLVLPPLKTAAGVFRLFLDDIEAFASFNVYWLSLLAAGTCSKSVRMEVLSTNAGTISTC